MFNNIGLTGALFSQNKDIVFIHLQTGDQIGEFNRFRDRDKKVKIGNSIIIAEFLDIGVPIHEFIRLVIDHIIEYFPFQRETDVYFQYFRLDELAYFQSALPVFLFDQIGGVTPNDRKYNHYVEYIILVCLANQAMWRWQILVCRPNQVLWRRQLGTLTTAIRHPVDSKNPGLQT